MKFAISIALLLLEPSIYSEIKSSSGVEVPCSVVSQASLLVAEVFKALSLAKTVKQYSVFGDKLVIVMTGICSTYGITSISVNIIGGDTYIIC